MEGVETPYANREIDQFVETLRMGEKQEHKQLQTSVDDQKIQLDRIETQTLKTNGRVRWLEKMIYLAIGGLGILSIFVLPLLWALISSGRI